MTQIIDSKIAKQKQRIEIKTKNVAKCTKHVQKLEDQLLTMQTQLANLEKEKANPKPVKVKQVKEKKAKVKTSAPSISEKAIELFEGAIIDPEQTFQQNFQRIDPIARRKGFLLTATSEGLAPGAREMRLEKAFTDHEFRVSFIKQGNELCLIEKEWYKEGKRVNVEQLWNQPHGLIVKPMEVTAQ